MWALFGYDVGITVIPVFIWTQSCLRILVHFGFTCYCWFDSGLLCRSQGREKSGFHWVHRGENIWIGHWMLRHAGSCVWEAWHLSISQELLPSVFLILGLGRVV
jgi:hypothetical protein